MKTAIFIFPANVSNRIDARSRSKLMDSIAAFVKRFSRVKVTISFSDKAQDLVRDGIDLAIRIGALKDSALKCKRLLDIPRTLVASSILAAEKSSPKSPSELADWDWIGVEMRPNHKTFMHVSGEEVRVDFKPRITVDSLDAVRRFTLSGMGLSSPPRFMVESDVREGRLAEMCPDWEVESLGVYAVWPGSATPKSLAYRLVEFLADDRSLNL